MERNRLEANDLGRTHYISLDPISDKRLTSIKDKYFQLLGRKVSTSLMCRLGLELLLDHVNRFKKSDKPDRIEKEEQRLFRLSGRQNSGE